MSSNFSLRKYIDIVSEASKRGSADDALSEEGRVVKGVNTTCDVGVDEITKQAAKFGNTVSVDGEPPLIYEEDNVPDDSEKSPIPKQRRTELPKPLKALFSKKKRR